MIALTSPTFFLFTLRPMIWSNQHLKRDLNPKQPFDFTKESLPERLKEQSLKYDPLGDS